MPCETADSSQLIGAAPYRAIAIDDWLTGLLTVPNQCFDFLRLIATTLDHAMHSQ